MKYITKVCLTNLIDRIMNKRVMSAMNTQINREFYAAYLYLAISAYYETLSLKGFASWMREQAKEEQTHAMKLYDFVFSRGGTVTLLPIEQPEAKFNNVLEAFEAALDHEKQVTAWIHEIAAIIEEEKDYASRTLIQWFVDEQIEEEETVSEICERLKMIGEHKPALFMFDKELATRQTEPVQE